MSDHENMIKIPNYKGKYFLDVSQEPYRIWSRRRAGCSGLFIKIELHGKRRFANLLNSKGTLELVALSDLVWSCYNPETIMKEVVVEFTDRNVNNDNINNLNASPRYIRDVSGNIIVSFS